MKSEDLKKILVKNMQVAISAFLAKKTGLVFNAFGFDTNVEDNCGYISLCLNTEEFLISHYEEHYGEYTNADDESVLEIKLNPGDMQFQEFYYLDIDFFEIDGFVDLDELDEDEFDDYDEYEEIVDNNGDLAYDLIFSVLNDLVNTDEFKSIPKSDNFDIICVDHEEDTLEAYEKTKIFLNQ